MKRCAVEFAKLWDPGTSNVIVSVSTSVGNSKSSWVPEPRPRYELGIIGNLRGSVRAGQDDAVEGTWRHGGEILRASRAVGERERKWRIKVRCKVRHPRGP